MAKKTVTKKTIDKKTTDRCDSISKTLVYDELRFSKIIN